MLSQLFQRKSRDASASHAAASDLFLVEALEARLLLSGAPMDMPQAQANLAAKPVMTPGSDHVVQAPASTGVQQSAAPAGPGAISLQNSFGATQSLPAISAPAAQVATGLVSAPGSGATGGVNLNPNLDGSSNTSGSGSAVTNDTRMTHAEESVGADADNSGGTSTPSVDLAPEPDFVGDAPSMASELVTTLRAANGPPAAATFSADVTNKLTSSTELALGSLVIAPIEGSTASGVSFSSDSLRFRALAARRSSSPSPPPPRRELPCRHT